MLVGQDTRVSSPWIFELLQKGFRAHSGNAAERRRYSDAGDCAADEMARLLRRRDDFSLAQSVSGQRHQGVRVGRNEAERCGRSRRSKSGFIELLGDEDVREQDGYGSGLRRSLHAIRHGLARTLSGNPAVAFSEFGLAARPAHRRGLREWRNERNRAAPADEARRRRRRDACFAERHEYQ